MASERTAIKGPGGIFAIVWHTFVPALLLLPVMLVRSGFRNKDHWISIPYGVPLFMFSEGCRYEFQHYFEPGSGLTVDGLGDICRFLRTCEYMEDDDQFDYRDYWQHPTEVEKKRAGDCEDLAMWAWTQLVTLGYETEFMVGKCRGDKHAWVTYADTESERRFLLEATATDPALQIRPLEDVKAEYVPVCSVDQSFRRRMYSGFVLFS